MTPGVQWLELALDYQCNLRCLGCMACNGGDQALSGAAVRALLERARQRGIPNLWIGGGEPTLRDDLLRIVATARRLGFERILLQTNGMRLAYGRYVDALAGAGVTDVSLNVKSHRAEVHDALSRREGTYTLLLQALDELARTSVRLAADVLVTRTTAPDLAETVRTFAGLGVTRFTLWLLSAADIVDPAVDAEVPRIADLHGPIRAAAAAAEAAGASLVTLHTPPCSLPDDLRRYWQGARDLRLEVVDAWWPCIFAGNVAVRGVASRLLSRLRPASPLRGTAGRLPPPPRRNRVRAAACLGLNRILLRIPLSLSVG